MFDYSKAFMILFPRSNYYDVYLIVTRYFLAELIILVAVNTFRMKKMHGSIGGDALESVPTLTAMDSIWRISKRWLASMEVRVL
jgi:hypothetical protein